MTTIHKDFGRICTKFEVTPFLKISQYMHSLNFLFVLSQRQAVYPPSRTNLLAYALGSVSFQLLHSSVQQLFLFGAVNVFFSVGIFLSFANTLSSPEFVYIFSFCISWIITHLSPFFSHKSSQEWSTCIASASYLSFLILLQSCFCSQQPDEKTPFKGTVWSLNNRQSRVLFSHWLLHLLLAFEAVNTSLPIFESLCLHPLWCCIVLFPPKAWLWFFLLSLPLLTLWACSISCSFSLILFLSFHLSVTMSLKTCSVHRKEKSFFCAWFLHKFLSYFSHCFHSRILEFSLSILSSSVTSCM